MIYFFITLLILLNILGKAKFKKILNPIFIFSIIFLFHNVSFFMLEYYDFPVFWNAPNNLSDHTINEVFEINIWAYLSFCIIFLLFSRVQNFDDFFFLSKRHYNFIYKIYQILAIISFIHVVLSSGGIYGAGQSLTSVGAFDPVKRIIDFRFYLAIFLIINSNKNNKIVFILVELILSIIGSERKSFVLVFCTYLFTTKIKISFKNYLKNIVLLLFLAYALIFINITRSDRTNSDLYERIDYVNKTISSNSALIFSKLLTASNSEGVQNWTYQLIEDNSMELSYGKSYLQALINMAVLRVFQGSIADWQAAYKFKYIAYPHVDNHGWDYSFTSEAIMNWGKSAYISYIILAFLIVKLYNRRNKNRFYNTIYHSVFPFLTIYFRTDSTSLMRAISYMILILIVYNYYSRKNRNTFNRLNAKV